MPVLSLRREEKALLLPANGHHRSVVEEPFKIRNGNTGRRTNRNTAVSETFWSPPSSPTANIPPTPPTRRILSSPPLMLTQPQTLSPSQPQTWTLSRTQTRPAPPPRGPPSPTPVVPPSPLLSVEETQFLTPRRSKQNHVGSSYPRRKFRRSAGGNSGIQGNAYIQLRETSGYSQKQSRSPTDRFALVFLSFLFHGLATSLPLSLLLVSDTFRTGLVGGCSPWMSEPANLLIVLVAFYILGALPSSVLPIGYKETTLNTHVKSRHTTHLCFLTRQAKFLSLQISFYFS